MGSLDYWTKGTCPNWDLPASPGQHWNSRLVLSYSALKGPFRLTSKQPCTDSQSESVLETSASGPVPPNASLFLRERSPLSPAVGCVLKGTSARSWEGWLHTSCTSAVFVQGYFQWGCSGDFPPRSTAPSPLLWFPQQECTTTSFTLCLLQRNFIYWIHPACFVH